MPVENHSSFSPFFVLSSASAAALRFSHSLAPYVQAGGGAPRPGPVNTLKSPELKTPT